MPYELVTLADFTSYHLDQVARRLEDFAREFPKSPAAAPLRSAAIELLPWDAYFRNCWRDVDFCARWTWLRANVISPNLTENTDLQTAIARLHTLVERREALPDPA